MKGTMTEYDTQQDTEWQINVLNMSELQQKLIAMKNK